MTEATPEVDVPIPPRRGRPKAETIALTKAARARFDGLALAKPLWGPMRSWRGGWLRGIMKNEDQGPARFSSCRREVHRRAARYNYMLFASAPDLLPIGRLKAGFARQSVPSLWTGVSM